MAFRNIACPFLTSIQPSTHLLIGPLKPDGPFYSARCPHFAAMLLLPCVCRRCSLPQAFPIVSCKSSSKSKSSWWKQNLARHNHLQPLFAKRHPRWIARSHIGHGKNSISFFATIPPSIVFNVTSQQSLPILPDHSP